MKELLERKRELAVVEELSAPLPDDSLTLTQLYELCSYDSEVQMLLMLQAEGAERADILRELEWDVTKYETVQKRKRKIVARLINEGKI